MVESGTRAVRALGLFLCLIGILVFLASFETWGSCPTTPCGGILMAFSEYSGIDLGFGSISAIAGLALIIVGIVSILRPDAANLAWLAALASVAIVAAAMGAILWMHVIPGDDKEFVSVPLTALLVGVLGLMALAASRSLGRPMAQVSGNSPT